MRIISNQFKYNVNLKILLLMLLTLSKNIAKIKSIFCIKHTGIFKTQKITKYLNYINPNVLHWRKLKNRSMQSLITSFFFFILLFYFHSLNSGLVDNQFQSLHIHRILTEQRTFKMINFCFSV